jgi:holo-[acyl-carrier protein] synthase
MDPGSAYVLGIGTDLCAVSRLAAARARHGQAFLDKVFTPAEQAECLSRGDPNASFAARWAAKEAVSKALGCGFGAELGLASVEVVTDPASGAPSIRLDALGERTLRKRGGSRVLISLSHDGGMATAYAVIVT